MSTRVNPIETEDCVSASVELESGALATLSVTTGSVVQITRHRMIFKNMVAESPTAPHTSTSDPWNFAGDTPEQSERIERALAEFSPKPEGFPGQFLHFYNAFLTRGKLPVTLADARTSTELITALYASARSLQPVELPILSDHPYYSGWQQFMGT
jgi:predicted dehydrogenase